MRKVVRIANSVYATISNSPDVRAGVARVRVHSAGHSRQDPVFRPYSATFSVTVRSSHTINKTRKATVAHPTVKRLLLHMFYATHPQKLMKSHEMV